MQSILEINGLCRNFGGLKALENCTLDVKRGTITGIIGPNGAGKTTLFNLIVGGLRPDKGTILLKGKNITACKPNQAFHMGISRTFQVLSYSPEMSVIESVILGGRRRIGESILNLFLRPLLVRKDENLLLEKALVLLTSLGLSDRMNDRVCSLSCGQRKMIGLAQALMSDPAILLLDEPTAGASAEETEIILEHLVSLRDRGLTVVIIEHKMEVIMNYCTRVIVLDKGKILADGSPNEVKSNKLVIDAYLGNGDGSDFSDLNGCRNNQHILQVHRDSESNRLCLVKESIEKSVNQRKSSIRSMKVKSRCRLPADSDLAAGEVNKEFYSRGDGGFFSVKNLDAAKDGVNILDDINLKLKKGEVVALIGPNGAGKTTLLNTLIDSDYITHGLIEFEGRNISGFSPNKILENGISLVPQIKVIFEDMSVLDNLKIASSILSGDLKKSRIEEELERFPILKQHLNTTACRLSGGERQMLTLSMGLITHPKIILLDEVTSGLAPQMISKIMEIIIELKKTGCSVLMAEQHAYQAIRISDYVYLLEGGRIRKEGFADEFLSDKEIAQKYLGLSYCDDKKLITSDRGSK